MKRIGKISALALILFTSNVSLITSPTNQISSAIKTSSITLNAVANSKGRTFKLLKDVSTVKEGELVDISELVEVVPGKDEDSSTFGDRSFTFKVYSEEEGPVLERFADLNKVYPSSTSVVAIAKGRGVVEVESLGATAIVSFDVLPSDEVASIGTILGDMQNSFVLTQNVYDDEGKLLSTVKYHKTPNYIFSENSKTGKLIHDEKVYDVRITPTGLAQVLPNGTNPTAEDLQKNQFTPADLSLRKFRYYSAFAQLGLPFTYAYMPMTSTDPYLSSVESTFGIPSQIKIRPSWAPDDDQFATNYDIVGLGVSVKDGEVSFYPIINDSSISGTAISGSVKAYYPLTINKNEEGKVDAIEKLVASMTTYPSSVTQEQSNSFFKSYIYPNYEDASNSWSNYTFASSGEFLDKDKKKIDDPDPWTVNNLKSFTGYTRKITKDAVWLNYADSNNSLAKFKTGGYVNTFEKENPTSKLAAMYQDENGKITVKTTTEDVISGTYTNVSTIQGFFPSKLANYRYAWMYPYSYTEDNKADTKKISGFGGFAENESSNPDDFIKQNAAFTYFTSLSTAFPQAYYDNFDSTIDVTVNKASTADFTVDIDIHFAISTSSDDPTIQYYYHLNGKISDVNKTVISGLDDAIKNGITVTK